MERYSIFSLPPSSSTPPRSLIIHTIPTHKTPTHLPTHALQSTKHYTTAAHHARLQHGAVLSARRKQPSTLQHHAPARRARSQSQPRHPDGTLRAALCSMVLALQSASARRTRCALQCREEENRQLLFDADLGISHEAWGVWRVVGDSDGSC